MNKDVKEFKEHLWEMLNKIRSISSLRLAMVSLANNRDNSMNDYNFVGDSSTHRVSDKHHACVLFHTSAIKDFEYLSQKIHTKEITDITRWTKQKFIDAIKGKHGSKANRNEKLESLRKRYEDLEKRRGDLEEVNELFVLQNCKQV